MPDDHPPSFLFILSDQQRRDSLGCYGNLSASTPALDALADSGVILDRAFTANVICSPSRASMMTGRYPRTHGLITNGMPLDADEITLPQTLATAGYHTAAVGKIHLSPCGGVIPEMAGAGWQESLPESRPFWEAGNTLPLPYYGFQEVRLCDGHGEDWADYYRDLKARDPKLPELLKKQNALAPPSGAPSSWKSAIPEEHHSSTWVADEAIKKLERYAGDRQPFFLFVGFPDPHFPYCPPAPWCDMFDPADVPMPRRQRSELKTGSTYFRRRIDQYEKVFGFHPFDMPDNYIREIIAHTYGMVSLLDKQVGRIVSTLDRLQLRDNTVVIFTTDHGEHIGDHWFIYKVSPYDELTHLPLIWSCPRRFGPRRRSTDITSHIDLMPTILDLARVTVPRGVQGLSYRAVLEGTEKVGRISAYLEDDSEDAKDYMRTLWTPRYRLTYELPSVDGELYDLEADPNEFHNRWNDPDYRSARHDMIEQLLQASIEASDPKPQRLTSA